MVSMRKDKDKPKAIYRLNHFKNESIKITMSFLDWFDALHPSQQLWSCRDGQFT